MVRGAGNRRMREGKPCVFCGGTLASDTTEHAPPKCMFHNKQRPQGYEFPACRRCNNGTSTLDALASFLFMSGSREALLKTMSFTKHQQNLARTVSRSFPRIYKYAHNASIQTPSGFIVGEAKRLELTSKTSLTLALWAAKQTFAYWHLHNSVALTKQATIGLRILTNNQTDDQFLNEIARLLGAGISMKHAKKFADDQFFYRYVRDSDMRVSFIQAVFHRNGGFFAVVDEESQSEELTTSLPHRLQTNERLGIHSIYPRMRSRLLYGATRY